MKHLIRNSLFGGLMIVGGAMAGSLNDLAEGPDFVKVEGVLSNQTLHMLQSPSSRANVVSKIPPMTDGVMSFGCMGIVNSEDRDEESKVQMRSETKTDWCLVGYDRMVGWVLQEFLVEGSGSADSFHGGSVLNDLDNSRWELQDLAGTTLEKAPTISFTSSDRWGSYTGCNSLNGSYSRTFNKIILNASRITKQVCSGTRGEIERIFMKTLDRTRQFIATEKMLVFFDANNVLLYTFKRIDY